MIVSLLLRSSPCQLDLYTGLVFIEIMTMFTWLLPWEYSYYLECMSRLKHYCRITEVLIIMVMSRTWLSLSYWCLHRNCNYVLLASRSQLCWDCERVYLLSYPSESHGILLQLRHCNIPSFEILVILNLTEISERYARSLRLWLPTVITTETSETSAIFFWL